MVSWEHSAFFWLWSFPRELGEPPCEPQGGCPFSQGEGQTFSECGLFPKENGGPPARDLRGNWFWGREITMKTDVMKERKRKRKRKREIPPNRWLTYRHVFLFTILINCKLTYRQNRFFMLFLCEIDTFFHTTRLLDGDLNEMTRPIKSSLTDIFARKYPAIRRSTLKKKHSHRIFQ